MHAHRIARAMGVPTEAATDEMHQMIDGKLAESEREPGNLERCRNWKCVAAWESGSLRASEPRIR